MEKLLLLNKPVVLTPLQIIEAVRRQYPDLKEKKMAYAGRLDPMAEGLMILLLDEECKNRKLYQDLRKEYEFEVLFGLSTDSYDVMGLVQALDFSLDSHTLKNDISTAIKRFLGSFLQQYPPYSSIRVDGHPLFYWARENRLSEIKVPSKKVKIYSLELLSERKISGETFLRETLEKLSHVQGKFRQQEIKDKLHNVLDDREVTFPVFKFKVVCSSGTYVRSIANDMGKALKIPSLAVSIKRTKIGEYNLSQTLPLDTTTIDYLARGRSGISLEL